jgi:hypothetical protein
LVLVSAIELDLISRTDSWQGRGVGTNQLTEG